MTTVIIDYELCGWSTALQGYQEVEAIYKPSNNSIISCLSKHRPIAWLCSAKTKDGMARGATQGMGRIPGIMSLDLSSLYFADTGYLINRPVSAHMYLNIHMQSVYDALELQWVDLSADS